MAVCVAAVAQPCPALPYRYENTERRQAQMSAKGIFHIGMGVSGGEEGARNGALHHRGGNRAGAAPLMPPLPLVPPLPLPLLHLAAEQHPPALPTPHHAQDPP